MKKYIIIKVLIIVLLLVLYFVARIILKNFIDLPCSVEDKKCAYFWIYSICKPIILLAPSLIVSSLLSFLLLSKKVSKLWLYTFSLYVLILAIKIATAPIFCGKFFDYMCTKEEVSSFGGKFFVVVTILFLIISLIKFLIKKSKVKA